MAARGPPKQRSVGGTITSNNISPQELQSSSSKSWTWVLSLPPRPEKEQIAQTQRHVPWAAVPREVPTPQNSCWLAIPTVPKAGLGLPSQSSGSHPGSPQPIGGYEQVSVPQFPKPLKKPQMNWLWCCCPHRKRGQEMWCHLSACWHQRRHRRPPWQGHWLQRDFDPPAPSGCTLYHTHSARHAAFPQLSGHAPSPQLSRRLHGPKSLCLELYKYSQKIR